MDAVLSKREHGRLCMTVAVGDERRHNSTGAVFYDEGTAGKPCGLIVGAVELTELGRGRGGADKRFRNLIDADNALCGFVVHFEPCGFGRLNQDHINKTVNHIRANRGDLLDVVSAAVKIVDQDSTVIAGSNLRDLVRTVSVGIDSELDACKGDVVITELLDLESAGRRRVNANGCRRHDLRRDRTKKDLLQAVIAFFMFMISFRGLINFWYSVPLVCSSSIRDLVEDRFGLHFICSQGPVAQGSNQTPVSVQAHGNLTPAGFSTGSLEKYHYPAVTVIACR